MTQRCIAGGIWSKTISPNSRSSAPSPRDTTRQSKASAPTSTLPLRSSPQGKCQQTLIELNWPFRIQRVSRESLISVEERVNLFLGALMSATKMFANLSIRNKIICSFLTLVLLIAALGFTSIQRFAALNNSVEHITTEYMLALGYLADMRGAILHYRLALRAEAMNRARHGNGAALEETLEKWAAALAVPEAKFASTVETETEKAIYAE